MGMKLLQQPVRIDHRRNFELFDDFTEYTTAKTWSTVATGSGSIAVSTTLQDGVLVLTTGSSTNDAEYVETTNPYHLWAANVPHVAEVLLQFSEASTNNANVVFGFSSSASAGLLVNASAGILTTLSGALIYKTGGSTVWKTLSSQSTTQNLTTTAYTAGQSAYTRLRVQCEMVNGVMEATYFIDQGTGMVQMRDNGNPSRPIHDRITLSSPSAMYLVCGIKAGTTASEVLNVDYLAAWKLRSNFVASA